MACSALVDVMLKAARKASKGILRDFGEIVSLQTSIHGPVEFVTAAIMRVKDILSVELSKAYPFSVISEGKEIFGGTDKSCTWIVTPVDGIKNLLHGIPLLATSIALERYGVIIAGVIYNPVTGELFVAERGKGAYLNDRRLRVSSRKQLSGSLIGTNFFGVDQMWTKMRFQELFRLRSNKASIRLLGCCSLSLAYVASGGFDGYIEENKSVALGIGAAGLLIVREAGGFTSDYYGKDNTASSNSVVAGNEDIHRLLLSVISHSKEQ